MNRNKLKTYAPAARRDFIQAVKDRAVMYGLSAKKIESMTERGDVVLIAGQPFPKTVAVKRKRLEERVAAMGFEQAMEAIAYSWFNRFVAIRFMELHGYLDHGYRVLSHPSGDVQPEILEHAQRVDFPGLDKNKVVELKLDGTKQEELYRLLLVAQCNALSQAMPFLFERIDDETELLLPSNLLATDSLIQNLVKEIDEVDWKEVEIIGWLYQFYISERKDEVIGKVVASEDIPAATQLFTPNWIVKYLVQNTLGRIWLATYPQSGIRQQMEFYIEPAEQTPEVQEQLKAITPTSLNPEELTLLDPACGSAHILVEAYDLFKTIYQERGYRAKDIPGLILSKNLYGLEIDDRAAQLAAFALLMKARADDRRILESGIQPNILAFVESKGMDAGAITHALNSPIKDEKVPPSEYLLAEVEEAEMPLLTKKRSGVAKPHVSQADIVALLGLFKEAKTFGSLIQVPEALAAKLPAIEERLAAVLKHGDLTHAQAAVIAPLLHQAKVLGRQYDAVVANPPYMGNRYLSALLKEFATECFPRSKTDLFAMFIDRSLTLGRQAGQIGLVTMQAWMFLSSLATLRQHLLARVMLNAVAHLGPRAFPEITGEVVQAVAFSLANTAAPAYRPVFDRCVDVGEEEKSQCLLNGLNRFKEVPQDCFQAIPGTPVAYWLPIETFTLYSRCRRVEAIGRTAQGLITGDNARFVRMWHEVPIDSVGFGIPTRQQAQQSKKRWFPYNKGGPVRRWYGNTTHVVEWHDDGSAIRSFVDSAGKLRSRPQNMDLYFRPAVSWSDITTSGLATRQIPEGFIFDATGPSAFSASALELDMLLSMSNSLVAARLAEVLNPTMHFQPGDFGNLPYIERSDPHAVSALVAEAVAISKADWDADETSWDFEGSPLLRDQSHATVEKACQAWLAECDKRRQRMAEIEKANSASVQSDAQLCDGWWAEGKGEVTLAMRHEVSEIHKVLSYAMGCMMGRYSLGSKGLIYAHANNDGFSTSADQLFRADEDGIVPVTEIPWFTDDAAVRFERFIGAAWPAERCGENLAYVAKHLNPKTGDSPLATIRRYFASDFFKHHSQCYSGRPIYWLFTSGKQGAFKALVYGHRFNTGTLARIRTEYVVPLLGRIAGRIGMRADSVASATTTKQRKEAQKETDRLAKHLAEVQAFDERLRHFSDQRIEIDLNDGVENAYASLGQLLATR